MDRMGDAADQILDRDGPPRILVIDHHDSFVHNLVRYLQVAGATTDVVRVDAVDLDGCLSRRPDGILLSPGPFGPSQTKLAIDLVQQDRWQIPIFGVCLGHQAIAVAAGGRVCVGRPMHGMADTIEHDGSGWLADGPSPMAAGLYHSLHVDDDSLPSPWTVTARSMVDGAVMGLRSGDGRIQSVQFHPESILSPHGHRIVERFVAACGVNVAGVSQSASSP